MFKFTVEPHPKAINIYSIDEDFDDEFNYIQNIPFIEKNNQPIAIHSKDSFLQKNLKLERLFNFFKESIHHYEEEILGIEKNNIFITQAWMNKSVSGCHHRVHNHANSILSGVFYFQDLDDYPVVFLGPKQDLLLPPFVKQTKYNCEYLGIPAKKGDLVLFPSSLYHEVPPNQTNNIRYSLAFNTFAKTLGHDISLTYLKCQ